MIPFIRKFIKGCETDDGESISNEEIFHHQLRSLWTALCLRCKHLDCPYKKLFKEVEK